MAKVLIVYASRTGETEQMGNLIAEGIRFSGGEAVVANVRDILDEHRLESWGSRVSRGTDECKCRYDDSLHNRIMNRGLVYKSY